jgi:hypothetical protein
MGRRNTLDKAGTHKHRKTAIEYAVPPGFPGMGRRNTLDKAGTHKGESAPARRRHYATSRQAARETAAWRCDHYKASPSRCERKIMIYLCLAAMLMMLAFLGGCGAIE